MGGLIVEHVSWRWIFLVNIPLGLVAFVVIGVVFHSPAERGRPSIDFAGAAAMTGSLAGIVLFTSLGGTAWAWASAQSLALIVCGVLLGVVFVYWERRAPDPILPLHLFHNRVFSAMSGVSFVVGVTMFGALTYLPVFLQIVKGMSPTRAGLLLTPMTVGTIFGAITSGRLASRTGRYKAFLLAGIAVIVVGVGLLSRIGLDTTIGYVLGSAIVVGLGIGFSFPMQTIAVQNAVPLSEMGVGTSGRLVVPPARRVGRPRRVRGGLREPAHLQPRAAAAPGREAAEGRDPGGDRAAAAVAPPGVHHRRGRVGPARSSSRRSSSASSRSGWPGSCARCRCSTGGAPRPK